MSQTILVIEDDDLGRMYSLNLNIFAGTDVVIKCDHQEALDLLKVHPSVDLIICQNQIKNAPTAQEILSYLQKEERKISLVVLGGTPDLSKTVEVLPLDCGAKELVSLCAKILGVTAQEMVDRPIPQLYPIPVPSLLKMEQAVCDIYLRVKRNAKDDHFVKRFKARDPLSKGALFRYIGYGENFLYVMAADRIFFTQSFTKSVIEKLKSENLSPQERVALNNESMKMAVDSIKNLGMTEETTAIIDASIGSIMATVKDSPTLEPLFRGLMSNKSSYLYMHCQVIVFICNHIMKKIPWASPGHVQKLGIAAFFHDILLESDKLVTIRSEQALAKAECTPDERILVLKHAQLSSELIKKFPSDHMDTDIIVRQHHGAFGGYGFVEKYPANISPLAMVFILAEDYAHYLIENFDKSTTRIAKIAEMRKIYRPFKYQQILDTLEILPI